MDGGLEMASGFKHGYASPTNTIPVEEAESYWNEAQQTPKDSQSRQSEGEPIYKSSMVIGCTTSSTDEWTCTLPSGVCVHWSYEYDNTPGCSGSDWAIWMSHPDGRKYYEGN